jgi:acyl transferase domain-containing protein
MNTPETSSDSGQSAQSSINTFLNTIDPDPIVIIGTGIFPLFPLWWPRNSSVPGYRLPGDVRSAAQLWDILCRGASTQSPHIPETRFNGKAHRAGGGYFLNEDPHCFSPDHFQISPAEAVYMDPQQRKLLEVIYECFENAGYGVDQIAGRNVGCYIANFTIDWIIRHARDPEYYSRYSAAGMGTTILANRVSSIFDLRGPR